MKIILPALAIALLSTLAMAQSSDKLILGEGQAPTPLTPGMAGTLSSRAIQSLYDSGIHSACSSSNVSHCLDVIVRQMEQDLIKEARDELGKAHEICLKKYYSPGSSQLGVKPGWSFPECETIDKKWTERTRADDRELIERAAKQ